MYSWCQPHMVLLDRACIGDMPVVMQMVQHRWCAGDCISKPHRRPRASGPLKWAGIDTVRVSTRVAMWVHVSSFACCAVFKSGTSAASAGCCGTGARLPCGTATGKHCPCWHKATFQLPLLCCNDLYE